MRKLLNKKGQISLGDAPTIVLIVGLVFLIMATVALVGEKYGDSFGSNEVATRTGESVTPTDTGTRVAGTGCNFAGFTVSSATNGTDTIDSGNYSTSSSLGTITNLTSEFPGAWTLNYTYTYARTACNITDDLNTEIGNNTSIAGIVLTISLIGIVLAVLISVFVTFRTRRL